MSLTDPGIEREGTSRERTSKEHLRSCKDLIELLEWRVKSRKA